jgi:cell division protein FtsB
MGLASTGSASTNPLRLGQPGVHLITLVLVLLSVWSLSIFVSQVLDGAKSERRKDELQAEVDQIEAENAIISERAAEAESLPYAERIAREQLGYAREGDTVILPTFPEHTPVPVVPTTVPAPMPGPQANWRGWARAFFPPDQEP